MSLNEFMHPNNIYRVRPNFEQMAKQFESFRPFVRLDVHRKATIDFTDHNALRALTQTLLKKDFDLDVNIPDNRLIPTVPQRLNYVLWVQDLVNKLRESVTNLDYSAINGVDIGTGCCAIFPLIATAINQNWQFVATELDLLNIETAKSNVDNNNLSHKIKIIEAKQSVFNEAIKAFGSQQAIHFCMCNPPFFSDTSNDTETLDDCDVDMNCNEVINDTNSYHKRSKSNNSIAIESSVAGGELAFVNTIIDESIALNNRIAIYTVMFGKKINFLQIKALIKNYIKNGVFSSYVSTEFCQGKTKRWGIAWTTIPKLDLKSVPKTKSANQKSLIYYLPPIMKDVKYELSSISGRIKYLLEQELHFDSIQMIRKTKKCVEFELKTNRNTWCHQRKKRRQAKVMEINNTVESISANSSVIHASNGIKHNSSKNSSSATDEDMTELSLNELNSESTNIKRKFDESSGDEMVINSCGDANEINKKCKNQSIYRQNETYLLHCSLIVKRDHKAFFIRMQTKQLSQTKESTYQLFQYFQNKLS